MLFELNDYVKIIGLLLAVVSINGEIIHRMKIANHLKEVWNFCCNKHNFSFRDVSTAVLLKYDSPPPLPPLNSESFVWPI